MPSEVRLAGMKNLIFSSVLFLSACGPTYETLAPTATPNPMVLIGLPLCSELNPAQHLKLVSSVDAWNAAFPELNLKVMRSEECLEHYPKVVIGELPEDVCGLTTPAGITFKNDGCLTQCVANHEVGHWAGLIRHAPSNEPGAMSDGDRGDCLPSAQDVVILTRTYLGKGSP